MTDIETPTLQADHPMPPAIDPLSCEPGTVPGWLNEEGLPTSCVGDLPNPGDLPEFVAEPAPVEPAPAPEADPAPEVEAPAAPAVEAGTLATETLAAQPAEALAETGPHDGVLAALLVLAVGLIALGAALTRRRSA